MYGRSPVCSYGRSPVRTEQPVEPARRIPPMGQVSATDVVGRDLDIRRFWNRLLAGSCLLNEPRRIGKSSVLLRMVDQPKPPGWHFLKSSVQGVKTTDEFAALVLIEIGRHRSVADRIKQTTRGFLEEAEVNMGVAGSGLRLRGAFQQTPLRALEAALAAVDKHLAEDDEYLAIAWDEFPDAVVSIIGSEGPGAAAALLGTLRRFRDDYPERLRWLLTGSVGLHHALRQLSSSGEQFVTDLQNLPLGPLDEESARWLAECLLIGAGCMFDEETMAAMVGETAGIAYLLHLLAARARDYGPRHVRAADVPELFAKAVGDLDASHQSTHLLSRLGDYYGDDTQTAEKLLDAIAASPAARADLAADVGLDDKTARELLALLTRDHYIEADDAGRYAWRYEPLRRIWVQRRSM